MVNHTWNSSSGKQRQEKFWEFTVSLTYKVLAQARQQNKTLCKNTNNLGWGDGLVEKAMALQAWEPTFESSEPT